MDFKAPIKDYTTGGLDVQCRRFSRYHSKADNIVLTETMPLLIKRLAPYLENHEVEVLDTLFFRMDGQGEASYVDNLLHTLQLIEDCGTTKRTMLRNMLRTSIYSLFYAVGAITTLPKDSFNIYKTRVKYDVIMDAWSVLFFNLLTNNVGQIKDLWLDDELRVEHANELRWILLRYSLSERGADKPDGWLRDEIKHLSSIKRTTNSIYSEASYHDEVVEPIRCYKRALFVRGESHEWCRELMPRNCNEWEAIYNIKSPQEHDSMLHVEFSKRQRGCSK